DLRDGARYGVSIEGGTSYKTRLQEADEATTRIIEATPETFMLFGDLFFRNKDFPGKDDIADRMMKVIRGQHPELFDESDNSPEAMAGRVAGLQGQVQQLTQQLQQATQVIQTKQVEAQAKAQADITIAQIKAAVDQAGQEMQIRIAEMNNAAKIRVAE